MVSVRGAVFVSPLSGVRRRRSDCAPDGSVGMEKEDSPRAGAVFVSSTVVPRSKESSFIPPGANAITWREIGKSDWVNTALFCGETIDANDRSSASE